MAPSRPTETSTSSSGTPLDVLLATLDLEQIDRDLFRGVSPPSRLSRVFGGQVAAQALVAAQRTVPGIAVHSLHAYFLRPGAIDLPIVFEVDRIRDGRSYTTRRVVGVQRGKAIFNLQASFHVEEEGWDHQLPMPDTGSDPSSLPPFAAPFDDCDDPNDCDDPRDPDDPRGGDRKPWPGLPFELRVAPPAGGYDRLLWFRTAGRIADDAHLHRCVATYASDLTLVTVALPAGMARRPSFMASLDHAIWFHRPLRADEWLLYAQSSPSASGGRGMAEGRVFTADGRLALSVVQEGAIRL